MVERGGVAHRVMERLDHGAIFILIAGTLTPVHGILYCGWQRWGPLAAIWAAAVTGITLKTIFFDSLAEWVGLTFYLTLGWFGGVTAVLLGRRYGFAFVQPLLLGGVVYSVGGAMEFHGWPEVIPRVVHPHEVFHLAVLGGAFLHWLFVWQFATGEVHIWRRPHGRSVSGP
jgi:hemolysin III